MEQRPDTAQRRSTLTLKTARTRITPVTGADGGALFRYHLENAGHLAAWQPLRPPDEEAPDAWEERAVALDADHMAGRSIPLVARLTETDRIVALASFTGIMRGAFQACHLGFSVDARHEGQGLMREVLEAALAHVFEHHRLHRVMASHLPENTRSAGLLARMGFEREGFARDYLKIGGRWRDHVLMAKINPKA